MQDDSTPATEASYNGHTDTLSLLLLNNADVNTATKAWQLKNIFQYLNTISHYLRDEQFDLKMKI